MIGKENLKKILSFVLVAKKKEINYNDFAQNKLHSIITDHL